MQEKSQDEIEIEHHLSVGFIAGRMKVSTDTVRRWFENEPGVVKIGHPSRRVGKKLKRSYFMLRIPQSVFERVVDRMTQKTQQKKLAR